MTSDPLGNTYLVIIADSGLESLSRVYQTARNSIVKLLVDRTCCYCCLLAGHLLQPSSPALRLHLTVTKSLLLQKSSRLEPGNFHHHVQTRSICQLPDTMASNRNRRIAKEIADIHNDSHSQVTAEPVGAEDDLTHLRGSFRGPPGTPYEDGTFFVDIKIPNEYPFRPPVMKFETKVYHPNISSQTVSLHRRIYDLLSKLLTVVAGRHLSRYAILRLVSSPHDKIRSSIFTVPSQHTRAQGSSRRRGCQYAVAQAQGV